MAEVKIFDTADALTQAATQLVRDTLIQATASIGRAGFVLSGGSTPKPLYENLRYERGIDWAKTDVFFGDERCVPPDHADSNYLMASETLLNHVEARRVYRMQGEIDPDTAATTYEDDLRHAFGTRPPQFDLVLLGLGNDGHTASLFPGAKVVHEKERWVAAVYVEKLESWRITLTPVLLNQAQRIVFLVRGADKAHALRQVLQGEFNPDMYPAQIVRPHAETSIWLVDAEAAAELT